MGKIRSAWVGFGIGLGALFAGLVIWFLKGKFRFIAMQDSSVKDKLHTDFEEYRKALDTKAGELAAMKADEVVDAFRKAFGGK